MTLTFEKRLYKKVERNKKNNEKYIENKMK